MNPISPPSKSVDPSNQFRGLEGGPNGSGPVKKTLGGLWDQAEPSMGTCDECKNKIKAFPFVVTGNFRSEKYQLFLLIFLSFMRKGSTYVANKGLWPLIEDSVSKRYCGGCKDADECDIVIQEILDSRYVKDFEKLSNVFRNELAQLGIPSTSMKGKTNSNYSGDLGSALFGFASHKLNPKWDQDLRLNMGKLFIKVLDHCSPDDKQWMALEFICSFNSLWKEGKAGEMTENLLKVIENKHEFTLNLSTHRHYSVLARVYQRDL